MKRTLIIQKQITPYWTLIFNQLNSTFGNKLLVVYCQKVEEDRKWIIDDLAHPYVILNKNYIMRKNRQPIYINLDIIKIILSFKPEVFITYGFNPVMLIAWIYSLVRNVKHIALVDAWSHTVNQLSFFHKLTRRIVFKYSDAFICVGIKSNKFLKDYKVSAEKIFLSRLVIDNAFYSLFSRTEKIYDIIFSGQMVENKMPFFVIEIANALKKNNKDLKLLIIGSGPLENKILKKLDEYKINYFFPGFVQQKELPKYYASAKILLFPSKQDVWGMVANEACAVGTPVITTEFTGVAEDLIIDSFNGYVLPLNQDVWVKTVKSILQDTDLYSKLSLNAIEHVQKYNIHIAADGFIKAIEHDCT